MDIQQKLEEAEAAVKAAGLSMEQFYRRAGIQGTSWRNWRRGVQSPTFSTWNRVEKALTEIKGAAHS